jgi:hypothetical protein
MHKLMALLLLLSPMAHAGMVGGVIDLTDPGALESLRDRRPDHYAKVRAILKVAETRPAVGASQWIEARAGASDVELLQWRVSDPPKLVVSFTLDDTRYTAQVVPFLPAAHAVPAR